jgi:hypothetical protein
MMQGDFQTKEENRVRAAKVIVDFERRSLGMSK